MAFFIRYTGNFLLAAFILFFASCNNKPAVKSAPVVTESLANQVKTQLPDTLPGYKKIALLADSMQLHSRAGNWKQWIKTGMKLYGSVDDDNLTKDSLTKIIISNTAQLILDSLIAKSYVMPDDDTFNLGLCKAYCLKGFYYNKVNDLKKEADVLDKCLANRSFQNLDKAYLDFALPEIMQVNTKLGDNKKAMVFFPQLVRLYKDNGGTINDKLNIYSIAGNTLRSMGQFDSAIHLLLTCEDSLRYASPGKQSFLLGVLAENYNKKNDRSKAKLYTDQSLKILRSIPDDYKTKEDWSMLNQLLAVDADISYDHGQFKEAIINYNNALESYRNTGQTDGREIAKINISKGDCFSELGLNDSAMKQYQHALRDCIDTFNDSISIYQNPGYSDLYAENAIVDALEHKADLLVKMAGHSSDTTQLKAAVDCYSLSLKALEILLQPFTYDDSRISALEQAKTITENALLACNTLLKKTGNPAWAAKAFHFAEQTKATVLLESLKKQVTFNNENDTLFNQLTSLQKRSVDAENEPMRTQYDKDDIAEVKTHDSLQLVYNDLQAKLLNVETLLKNSNSQYAAVFSGNDSISVDLVQQKLLTNKNILVDYFTGDSSLFVFIAQKNQPLQFYQLNSALKNELDSFFLFFTDKNKIADQPAAYAAAAYHLFTQLKLDLLPASIAELILIPDGKLSTLPFEALLTANTSSLNMQQWPYFLKTHLTSYGFSVATLLQQASPAQPEYHAELAAFAPVFEGKQRGLPALLNTAEEIKGIEKNFGKGNYFSSSYASIGNFKSVAAKSGILHLATHAYADTALLQQPRIEFIDSSLHLNELYAMKLHASLVVLSACETGIGRIAKSEGPMSLARGCYYAGARNVISSLWEVDDKSTGDLFNRFYNQLNKNNYAGTLQQAKLSFINDATPAKASPFYWASFIHIGYQPPAPVNYLQWIGGAAVLLLFFALVYFKNKK